MSRRGEALACYGSGPRLIDAPPGRCSLCRGDAEYRVLFFGDAEPGKHVCERCLFAARICEDGDHAEVDANGRPKKWHIITPGGWPGCRDRLVDDEQVVMAIDVPDGGRCMAPACRAGWRIVDEHRIEMGF